VDDNGDTDMKLIYRVIIHFWHKRFNDMTVKELNAVAALLQNKWLPWYYKKRAQHADFSIKMVNLDATKKTQTEDNGK
jgi:hypothetical protein